CVSGASIVDKNFSLALCTIIETPGSLQNLNLCLSYTCNATDYQNYMQMETNSTAVSQISQTCATISTPYRHRR
ncbi:hypothetical protein HK100_011569, partial [Physocladia obscura]